MVSCICSLKPIQRSSYTPHGSAHLEVGTASPFSRSISHSSWRAMNRSRKATWECSDNKLKAIVYTYNNTVNVYLVYVYIYEYRIRNRDWNQNEPSTVVDVSPLQLKMSGQIYCYILSGDQKLMCNFQTVLAWGIDHHWPSSCPATNTRKEHEQASLSSRRTASSHSYQETKWYGLQKAWHNVTSVKPKMTPTRARKKKKNWICLKIAFQTSCMLHRWSSCSPFFVSCPLVLLRTQM